MSTSRTVAPRTVTHEPSVPTSARARSPRFSGSRCSSEYPGDLALERAQLGAQQCQVVAHQPVEPGDRLQTLRSDEPAASAVDHVQRVDVVGGAAESERPRSASVVADHAAEGAARPGGRIGSEPQAVRGGRVLERAQHHARLDDRGARLGVDREDAVQVP